MSVSCLRVSTKSDFAWSLSYWRLLLITGSSHCMPLNSFSIQVCNLLWLPRSEKTEHLLKEHMRAWQLLGVWAASLTLLSSEEVENMCQKQSAFYCWRPSWTSSQLLTGNKSLGSRPQGPFNKIDEMQMKNRKNSGEESSGSYENKSNGIFRY